MIFDLHDLKEIILLSILLLSISFSLYFPILGLFRESTKITKYTVPISWSFEIIVGYIFYSTKQISIFPQFYLILILVLNLWFFFGKKLFNKTEFGFIKEHLRAKNIIFFLLILIPIFFSFFYDAIQNTSPIQRDAFGHITFLRQLATTGRLGLAFYAPGFHILLLPAFKLIDTIDLYRFSGPIFGIIQVLSIWFMFKDKFNKPISGYLLLLLFALPIYNQLTIQLIGFFPSALTFLFLASAIRIISDEYTKNNLLVFFILFLAIALTVPYFLIQFIPAIMLGFVVLLFTKGKVFGKQYTIYYLKLLIIASFMLVVAFGHVYLQTKIGQYNAFPKIPAAVEGTMTDNYKLVQPNTTMQKNSFLNHYISPLIASGLETIKIKNVRKPDSVLSVGAYLWLLFGLASLFYSIKKKNRIWFALSVYTIIYGIAIQTGILEMSFYRGRSGWYFMLLSILGIAYVFDQFYERKFKIALYLATPILIMSCFLYPPKYYRIYYPEIFNVVYNIYKQDKNQKIVFYTDTLNETQEKFSLLTPNFTTKPLEDFMTNKESKKDNITSYLILEKRIITLDPVLSAGAVSTDKNFSNYYKTQQDTNDLRLKMITEVKNSEDFKSNYKIFWQNNNIEIYQRMNI